MIEKRLTAIAVPVALAFLLVLLGCNQHDGARRPLTSILRRGLGGEPSTLDPAGVGDAFTNQVVQDICEGLTTESPDGSVIPAVAASWEVDSAGTRYTFHIRPDARWSNGKRVRSSDFVTAWQRVVDPKVGSPLADNLRFIHGAPEIISGKAAPATLGVSAPTDEDLIVTLDLPAPYFPEILSQPAAFPIYSEPSARTHDPKLLVCNGPYVLSKWQTGGDMELSKSTTYWDRSNVHVDSIVYRVASEETSQYAQYRSGDIDLTDTVPASVIPEFRKGRSNELIVAPYLATAYYGLNLASRPMATNLKLRQALAMAIDRKTLVASFGFGQPPAYGLVPPGVWNYQPQSFPWRDISDESRITEARRLFREAGYSDKSPLRLHVLYNSNTVIKRTAIMIAAMWKEALGIETELTEQEFRAFLITRHDKAKWDVARLSWVADFNDASNFLDTLRSNSTNNDESYSNSSYDGLLDEAARSMDPMKRRSLLEAAEIMALNDYPIIPLYHFVSKRLVKPYVLGVRPTPLDRVPSKALAVSPR